VVIIDHYSFDTQDRLSYTPTVSKHCLVKERDKQEGAMNHIKWQIFLGASMIALSSLFYLIHYFLFRDTHHIILYLIGDTAFVFIQVLLGTLIIDQVMALREKRFMLEKLNMVIGSFFSISFLSP
jgi:hypothetical protein